ncbi:MAG TPA: O-antigen ligase family protein [Candidatus Limnocylindrales bacterium]|nr:O-antigen ligase family protein [Candidatus Limnocylindrales bacterium]
MTALDQALPRLPEAPADLRPRIFALGGIVATVVVAAGFGAFTGEYQVLGVALAAVALAAIVMVRRPDTATFLVMAILYSNAAAIAVQFHGLPYLFGASFSLLLVVPVAYYLIARRETVTVTSALPWVVVYLLVNVVSALFSAYKVLAFDDLFTFFVEGFVLYVFVTNAVRDMATLRTVIWVLLLVGGAIGALSGFQEATHSFNNEFGGFAQISNAVIGTGQSTLVGEETQPRLSGPIGEKNRYAQIMIVLLPLGLFRMWGERRMSLKVLAGSCTMFIALGAAFTFSRGGAVGVAMLIGLMAVLRYISWRQIAVFLLAMIIVLVAVPTYAQRLTTLVELSDSADVTGTGQAIDGSFRERAVAQIAAFLVFVDHPIMGVGPGLFGQYYQEYAGTFAVAENLDREAHNLYLGIAADTGILGLGAFMLVLGTTLRDLVRGRRRWLGRRPDLADTATAFSLALISYMTTGVFLHMAYPRYFWVLAALAGVAAHLAMTEPEPEDLPTGLEPSPSSPPQGAGWAPTPAGA